MAALPQSRFALGPMVAGALGLVSLLGASCGKAYVDDLKLPTQDAADKPDVAVPQQLMSSGTGNIQVRIQGLRSATGQVCLNVFNRADGFPNQPGGAVVSVCKQASDASGGFVLEGLAFGNYALALVHDENNNGSLDTGAFGIPKEGFGFSNNPPLRMGAPNFGECAFSHGSALTTLSIDVLNI